MLELINLARTNPPAAAERVTSNLTPDIVATLDYYGVNADQAKREISSATPQPPVAWNPQLANAAQGHSQDMANTRVQSHSGSDGSTINSRISNAGYSNASSVGENAYAYGTSVDEAMQAFLFDWGVADKGHRRNLLQPNVSADNAFQDVGIGIVHTKDNNFGPLVITQDFGNRPNEKAQLLGTVYNDNNGNRFYDIGEGAGNVLITATNLATGATASVPTWDAGGYQMPLDPGRYQVTATVNNRVVKSTTVSIGTVNVQHDFILNDSSQDVPAASTSSQARTITVAVPSASTSSSATSAPSSTPTTFKANVTVSSTGAQAASSTGGGFLAKWSSWKAKIS
jgi:uncharacterized protein YkwD